VLSLQNLDAFDRSVQGWLSAVERATEQASVGLAKAVFKQLLQGSPQYSGDFAANWKVGYNFVDQSFEMNVLDHSAMYSELKGSDGLGEFEPFSRGDMPAISYAESKAQWRTLKLGETIYLSNSAHHLDAKEGGEGVIDLYGWKIENNEINFRPGNRGSGAIMRRSLAHIGNRYRHIGAAQLSILSRVGV
jgi:hypothetical protein